MPREGDREDIREGLVLVGSDDSKVYGPGGVAPLRGPVRSSFDWLRTSGSNQWVFNQDRGRNE